MTQEPNRSLDCKTIRSVLSKVPNANYWLALFEPAGLSSAHVSSQLCTATKSYIDFLTLQISLDTRDAAWIERLSTMKDTLLCRRSQSYWSILVRSRDNEIEIMYFPNDEHVVVLPGLQAS